MIRPSALPRLAVCPTSAALPQINRKSPFSTKGTAIHTFLADYLTHGDEAYGRIPEEFREVCYAVNVAKLPIGIGTVKTEFGLFRKDIRGTADIVASTPTGGLVMDIKSGYMRQVPAREHKQLLWYAVAAAEHFGWRSMVVGINRVMEDGEVWNDIAELDGFDLDAAAAEVDRIVARATNAKATDSVTTGDHCRYCPAFASCPATREVAGMLVKSPDELQTIPLTEETAGVLWQRAKLAEKVVEMALDRLKEFARSGAIVLPNGNVVEAVTVERRALDAEKTFEVVKGLHGETVAADAVNYNPKATFTSVKEALQKIAPKGKLAAMERESTAALEAAGAVSTSTHVQVKETKRRELK